MLNLSFLKKIGSFKPKMPNVSFSLFGKSNKLYKVWGRFLKQIPPSYRHFIQSYPRHFIVIGKEGSGKSQLIQKFIDRERDIYSFETSYTANGDLQFYLGQRYILQEISWNMIEDRSIGAKKQLTNLWRRLYANRDPHFVVMFNPLEWEKADSEKINHYARLLLNKIVLLSHLVDKPIKVRIAFTHMDTIEGYSELLRMLHLSGQSLEVSLSSYDSNTLKTAFTQFEQALPIALKNLTGEEYLKVLKFFKKLSDLWNCLDQFVRSMMQKDYEKKVLVLEQAYFVSNQESDIGSEVFDCQQELAPSVYIKRRYFKHQIASLTLAVIGCLFAGGMMLAKKHELNTVRARIAQLERYQNEEALAGILPYLHSLEGTVSAHNYWERLTPFYSAAFKQQIDDLVEYSRDYIFTPTFRKIVLNNLSEIEMVYFLSFVKATKHNRLGQIIGENAQEWATMLNLPAEFVKAYVTFAQKPQPAGQYLDEFMALTTSTPLSEHKPWFNFFEQMQRVIADPNSLETYLPELRGQAERLLSSLKKLEEYSLTPFLCKILMEDEEMRRETNFLPKIRLLQDLRDNNETFEMLLSMVQETDVAAPSYAGKNIKAFLENIDTFLAKEQQENFAFRFILGGRKWLFDSDDWTEMVAKARVKKIVDDYVLANRDLDVAPFFHHANDLYNVNLSYLGVVFPQFEEDTEIRGMYTVSAYERHIYPIADTLTKLNASRMIDEAVKNDLNHYVAEQVESYARQYKEQYERLLRSFEVCPDTFEEASRIIGYMIEPLSHFTRFLHTVRSNLTLPHSESLVLNPMSYLSEFDFIRELLPAQLDQAGEMHTYQAFLRKMLAQVRKGSVIDGSTDFGALEKYLSPLSRMSLAILTEQSDSFQTQMEEWLEATEIPIKYQSFFMNPVNWVRDLGLRELKNDIEVAWQSVSLPKIFSLFGKFPFNPEATEVASREEVEAILHPQSAFWNEVFQIAGVVSMEEAGHWSERYPEQLKLEASLYDTMNLIASVTNTLWDETGAPQPLQFKVRTVPFRTPEHASKQVVSSYMITQGQALYNINQHPQTEIVLVKWWDPDEILIGFEMVEDSSQLASYVNRRFDDEEWNVFKFLQLASRHDEHVWNWSLPDDQEHEFALYFDEDPWKLLNPMR